MSSHEGPAKWWTVSTDTGRKHIATKGIATSNLVMNLDAAVSASYSGSGNTWIDLTGTQNNVSNTINTMPSFSNSYNGVLSFNGTTDELHPNVTHSYLSSSCLECWFYISTNTTQRKMIIGYWHEGGYYYPQAGSLFLSGSNLNASLITELGGYRVATVNSMSLNKWYHAVLYKDVTNGVLNIYLNGVLAATADFNSGTYGRYAYWSGSYHGQNSLDIGKSSSMATGQNWGDDYFSGYIPIVRLYSGLLTSKEITQNFNAYRNRFGV